MSSSIFQCHECQRAFLIDRDTCCPEMERGIINCGPLFEMKPNWKRRVAGWGIQPVDHLIFNTGWMTDYLQDSPVGKYLPEKIQAAHKKPYQLAMSLSGFRKGVVLDYGCCLAHGSNVIKDSTPKATYIGVDREPLFLVAGSTVYDPDFLYLSKEEEDREQPLKHIASDSVDMLISSQITVYVNWKNVSSEWLRLLQTRGFLYFETHTIHSEMKDTGNSRVNNYVPDKSTRILVAKWLSKYFDIIRSNCTLTDFVEGKTRLSGLFQKQR